MNQISSSSWRKTYFWSHRNEWRRTSSEHFRICRCHVYCLSRKWGGVRMEHREKFTCFVDADDFLADPTGSSRVGWSLRCLKVIQGRGAFILCHCPVTGHRSASGRGNSPDMRGLPSEGTCVSIQLPVFPAAGGECIGPDGDPGGAARIHRAYFYPYKTRHALFNGPQK